MTTKTALITGASRGIGRAILLSLAEAGFTVAGTATTDAGAEQISDLLIEKGFSGKGYALDVRNKQQLANVYEQLSGELGAPLVLVNNAGVTADNLVMRMKDTEWENVIATNLTATFQLCRLASKAMMKARWGRVVNVSSVVGVMGHAGQANYAASKAGLIGFSKSFAAEMASRNITVNVIAPGYIETDMTSGLSEAQREQLFANIPAGRVGRPEEIAAAVQFLVSDVAAYITGQTLHINGGMLMP